MILDDAVTNTLSTTDDATKQREQNEYNDDKLLNQVQTMVLPIPIQPRIIKMREKKRKTGLCAIQELPSSVRENT